jgi:hypothetical protein
MDPDPDPTPNPTPFFIEFKDAKKYFFFLFFSYNCPQAHHLQSKKYFRLMDPDQGNPKTCGSPTLLLTLGKDGSRYIVFSNQYLDDAQVGKVTPCVVDPDPVIRNF